MNYLLVGNESYNLKKRRDELIEKAVGKDNDLAISFYNGNDKPDINVIIDDCQTAPFLVDKKVVVYENPLFLLEKERVSDDKEIKNDELNKVIAYYQNTNETTDFILYVDGSLSDKSKTLKEIVKYVKYEKYDHLTEDEFRNYVNNDLLDHKIKLDEKTLKFLLARLPISLENWKRELEKLTIYPGNINIDVINQLVCKPLEDNTFELSNAVVDKQLNKAISVLRDLLIQNKNDIPMLIGLLANQFRTMSQVKIMIDMGMPTSEIASQIGTKSEYRVKMVLKAIGNKSPKELLKILSDLSSLDQDIKMGKIEPQIGLEIFIMKACER